MISVIIPALNEEENLSRLLPQLTAMTADYLIEIIVVDGGSTDQTVEIANRFATVFHLNQSNRGAQLNYGVSKSAGDILWFLHSDSQLSSDLNIFKQIEEGLRNEQYSAGFFQLAFDSNDLFFRYLAKTSNLRAGYLGLMFGDQGMFMKRKVYEKAGGFEEIPLMEDWRLSRRLWKLGRFYQMPAEILTSSRRFKKGKLRTHLKMHKIKFLYLLGMPPEELAKRYYK